MILVGDETHTTRSLVRDGRAGSAWDDILVVVRAPTRVVVEGDAIAWLAARESLGGASVVTSLPDASETSMARDDWGRWYEDTVALLLAKVAPGAVAMFYQTDVRADGLWVDKAAPCLRASALTGVALAFHKVVCRAPPGTPRAGLAGFAHLLCFSRDVREDPKRPTPDVLPHAGRTTWTRGMGLDACLFACRWIAEHTPTRTIVDPFCGHGSVLAVANALGLDAVGVELGAKRARRARTLQVVLGPDGPAFSGGRRAPRGPRPSRPARRSGRCPRARWPRRRPTPR